MAPVSRPDAHATAGDGAGDGVPGLGGGAPAGAEDDAGSVAADTLVADGALAVAPGGGSGVDWFGAGGAVTASATCGSGAGNRRGGFAASGRFGSGFL